MITISDLLSASSRTSEYARLVPLDDSATPFNKLGFTSTIASKRMCGIEVEAEEVEVLGNSLVSQMAVYSKIMVAKTGLTLNEIRTFLFNNTSDGSLRNNGQEFVSVLGMHFALATKATQALECYFQNVEKFAVANARTGLHVHVDVRDLRLADLQRLLMLYLCFEEAIFDYSGARQGNIFCVPLSQTKFPLGELAPIHKIGDLRDLLISNAHKYMGLNLAPILTQGTVEFRMHRGTLRSAEINNWLAILSDLVDAVTPNGVWNEKNDLQSKLLSIESAADVEQFTRNIFVNSYHLIAPFVTSENFLNGMENSKEMQVSLGDIPEDCLTKKEKKKKLLSYTDEIIRAASLFSARPTRPSPSTIGRFGDNAASTAARFLTTVEELEEYFSRYNYRQRLTDEVGRDVPSNLPVEDQVRIENRLYIHKNSLVRVFLNGSFQIYLAEDLGSIVGPWSFVNVIVQGHARDNRDNTTATWTFIDDIPEPERNF